MFLVTKIRSPVYAESSKQVLELRRAVAIDAKDGVVKEKLLQEAGEGEQAQKNEKNNALQINVNHLNWIQKSVDPLKPIVRNVLDPKPVEQ